MMTIKTVRRRPHGPWPAVLLVLPFLPVAVSAQRSTPAAEPKVDLARTALEKWIETNRIIAREKRDWAEAREALNERIELVKREIAALQAKSNEIDKNVADADKKRGELAQENERLRQLGTTLAGTVVAMEERLTDLLRQLPEPIREKVKPLSQRIPRKAEETKLSLGVRFQNVVGVLNEIDKFQREVTVVSEVRALANGTSAEVTVLYVGLGQAYYVNAKGDTAGVGLLSPEGWAWIPANESASAISKAIAIVKGTQPAQFVNLPVAIR